MLKNLLLNIILLLIVFSFNALSNESNISKELINIQKVIDNASQEFELAKKEKDLKKLAEIAKKLYENHQLIKKLLKGNTDISFLCNDKECVEPKLQTGDKLTIIFNLSFKESEEYEKSKLIWQVQHNKKIIKKGDKEIYEKGGFKKFAKEVTIDESFNEGKYRVAMHHKSETGTTKGEAFFYIKRPIKVKDIVVSTDKEATVSDGAIYPDEDIYILSGFKLENLKNKVNIYVKLVDITKQKTLIETSFIRPKEDNVVPNQRLRFRIPASKLYKKQKLEFEMKLYADGINPIIKKITIPVRSFKLIVNVPYTLQAGRNGKYSIKVPKKFIEPIKVDIEPNGGILLSHKTKLTGRIEAINKGNEIGTINIRVTDAKGRTVSMRKDIKLTIKKENNQFIINDGSNKYIIDICCAGETKLEDNDYNNLISFKEQFNKNITDKYFKKYIVNQLKIYNKSILVFNLKFNNGILTKAYGYYDDGHYNFVTGKLRKTIIYNSKARIETDYDYNSKKGKFYKSYEYIKYKSGGGRVKYYHSNGKVSSDTIYYKSGHEKTIYYNLDGSVKEVYID